MLEILELWIRDPLIQSLFLSPLIGAIFGLILSSLTNGKKEKGVGSVKETIIVIRERIIIHERNNSRTSSPHDPIGLIIVWLAAIIIAVYFYAIYAEFIIYYLSLGAFNVITFGMSALAFSAIKGRLSGADWIIYTIIPIMLILFGLVLLSQAKQGILPGAKEAAQSAGAFKFYFNVLNDTQRNWIMPQLIGLMGTISFLFLSSVLVLHNLAVLQVIYDGTLRSFWRSIYTLTHTFSSNTTLIILIILGGLSYFALDGTAYQYLVSRNS